MCSGPVIEDNLKQAETLIREAAGQGAQFVLTPENTCHIRFPAAEKLKSALPEETHPAVSFFSGLARELNIWLLAGSLGIKQENGMLANRSYLFADTGEAVATYDKIHMFDVDLPTGENHRESEQVQGGTRAVLAQTPWGGLGMTICYDLRFPHLYRELAQKGAAMLAVPAAFTVPTGKAHWETLLRARAIENGCFVFAPAQTGEHEGGRLTYGHSLIIDPWGHVLADAGEEVGVITVDVNLEDIAKARHAIPSLQHDRDFDLP